MLTGDTGETGNGGADIPAVPESNVRSDGDQRPVSQAAFELLDAMKQARCPVCTLTMRGVNRYLDGLSYESVSDPDIREQLRRSLGFCAVHGQQWLGQKDALGTAIIYSDVLTQLRNLMQSQSALGEGSGGGGLTERLQSLFGNESSGTEAGRALAAALEPEDACPACRYARDSESRMCGAFAHGLGNEDTKAAYDRHPVGLCLPHFREVLRRTTQPSLMRTLADIQGTKWAQTSQQLAEVIRKHDYRFSEEPKGEEFQAPARGVEQVSGNLPTQLKLPSDYNE